MRIEVEDLPSGITRVILDGRMDIQGASDVDLQMNVIAGSRSVVLIDLERVTFLASMGLRTIVMAAQTLKRRGGLIRLVHPTALVEKVLLTSRIDQVIPIDPDLPSA